MNDLQICVSGHTSTGKTALLLKIRDLLRREGFFVLLHIDEQLEDVEVLQSKLGELKACSTAIHLVEQNVPRDSGPI